MSAFFVGKGAERQPHMACGARSSCYRTSMTDQALYAAVTRLERALALAERAAAARDDSPDGLTDLHASLEQRHIALRTRVQETIGQLDTLIADADAR